MHKTWGTQCCHNEPLLYNCISKSSNEDKTFEEMFCHLSADATLITGILQGPGLPLKRKNIEDPGRTY